MQLHNTDRRSSIGSPPPRRRGRGRNLRRRRCRIAQIENLDSGGLVNEEVGDAFDGDSSTVGETEFDEVGLGREVLGEEEVRHGRSREVEGSEVARGHGGGDGDDESKFRLREWGRVGHIAVEAQVDQLFDHLARTPLLVLFHPCHRGEGRAIPAKETDDRCARHVATTSETQSLEPHLPSSWTVLSGEGEVFDERCGSEGGSQVEVGEVRESEDEGGEEVGREEGGSESQSTEVGEEGSAKLATIVAGVREEGASGRKVGSIAVGVGIVLGDRVDGVDGRREEGRRAEVVSRDRLFQRGAVETAESSQLHLLSSREKD
jgi:hypothetical protein